ncbi:MAG: bifunctional DNA-binding transcriptional regulator/O6-methylguanine-DNA methyltransferase Ada [Hyphomicrobiaceae bacterium]
MSGRQKLRNDLLSEDDKWAAIGERNKAFDGVFYYCVLTTGIYCRPSCPARRAKRENVTFFDTPEAAENAGFRACKRCRPNAMTLDQDLARKITAVCRIIETAQESPKLQELADVAGLSSYHFNRVFKRHVGVTPKAYALAHRQKQVRSNLKKMESVTEAIYNAGFNSSGRFYHSAADVFGMTAKEFQNGGSSETISLAVGTCSLGSILVAQSEVGICAIALGDDPEQLVRDVQDQFPKGNFVAGNKSFENVVTQVIGLIEAPASSLDLPLDIRGTAFQHRVWDALRKIPKGSTVSYTDIAKAIGNPNSVRAVARACAANKIAVAIPCHRVVRTDGALSGYRWGIARKKALLAKEAGP